MRVRLWSFVECSESWPNEAHLCIVRLNVTQYAGIVQQKVPSLTHLKLSGLCYIGTDYLEHTNLQSLVIHTRKKLVGRPALLLWTMPLLQKLDIHIVLHDSSVSFSFQHGLFIVSVGSVSPVPCLLELSHVVMLTSEPIGIHVDHMQCMHMHTTRKQQSMLLVRHRVSLLIFVYLCSSEIQQFEEISSTWSDCAG